MRRIALLTALAAALCSALAGTATAAAGACGSGANGSPGYAYAGHQAAGAAHGIRATITPTVRPTIASGHVAGWIGVGGPGQGPNGETMWLQAGVAGMPGMGLTAYAEITRPGADPVFVTLAENVRPGQPLRLAVLEIAGRPGAWRVWLDGRPVTDPVVLRGSSKRWRPIATTESFTAGSGRCNTFGFRFEDVRVARTTGGSWATFAPGYRFLDRGLTLRQLRPVPATGRTLATDELRPYAFEAGFA